MIQATVEELVFFFLVKHTVIIGPSGCITGCLLQRNENLCLHKNLYTAVHSCFSCNSPKLETAEWLNKHSTSTPGTLLGSNGAANTHPPGRLSLLMLREKANFKRLQTSKFHLCDVLNIKLKKRRKESSGCRRVGMGKM